MAEFAIVQDDLRTTTGTQTFTAPSSPFSGANPKGAIILVSNAIANDTAAAKMSMSIGFTDGTTDSVVTSCSDDVGVMGTSNASNAGFTGQCIRIINGSGAAQCIVSFSAWAADGITLNVTTTGGIAYLVTVILFGGAGTANVTVGQVTTPTAIGDPPTTVNTLAFMPDALFVAMHGHRPIGSSTVGSFRLNFGIVERTGSEPPNQFGVGTNDYTSAATTANDHRTNSGTCYGDPEDTPTDHTIEVRNFTSSGFDAYTRGVAGAMTMMYIAVAWTGTISVKALAFDSPTDTTGTKSITGVGFTPQFGIVLLGKAAAYNTRYTDANAELFGIGAFTSAAQFCTSVSGKDAVAAGQTTDNKSLTSANAVALYNRGSSFALGNFTGFQSDGANFTYSDTDTTVRKWSGLFIEGTAYQLAVDAGSYTAAGQEALFRLASPLYLRYRK
jgi:hypothetical protein